MKRNFNYRALLTIADLIDFAVIVLSKAVNVERDHLIHRKRSPFPYEGKDLTRRSGSECSSLKRYLHSPLFTLHSFFQLLTPNS